MPRKGSRNWRPSFQRRDGLRARLELCRRWRGLDTPGTYAQREGTSRQAVLDHLRLIRRILEIPPRQRVDHYWLTSVYLERFQDLLEIQEGQLEDPQDPDPTGLLAGGHAAG